MSIGDLDHQVRTKAFDFLIFQVELHGEVLPRRLLEDGFHFDGIRVLLKGASGHLEAANSESAVVHHDGSDRGKPAAAVR